MKTFTKKILFFTFFIFSLVLMSNDSYSVTDTLDAKIDNTLYQNEFGALSNGKGQFFFSGTTHIGLFRRGLISFKVNEVIPPGAIVTDVQLVLHLSRTISGSERIKLYRVTKHWSEGESFASGEEGQGTQPEPGDATWIHNYFNTEFWVNAGGDYSSIESAGINVEGVGFYSWNNSQMISDVQDWINNVSPDYGWILIGNESGTITTKRFDTKDNFDSTVHPKLIVTYTLNDVALRMRALTEGLIQNSDISVGAPQSYPDTFRVYIRNSFAPYSIVDSAKVFHELESWYVFSNASSGSYYIMVNQRNSINTWSRLPQNFSAGVPFTQYDFTSAITQAFGSNLVLKDFNYCIYSGDVNKDNFINLTDVLSVYNSAIVFQTGYVINDINGDSIVDLTDIIIAYNNSSNFVQERRP